NVLKWAIRVSESPISAISSKPSKIRNILPAISNFMTANGSIRYGNAQPARMSSMLMLRGLFPRSSIRTESQQHRETVCLSQSSNVPHDASPDPYLVGDVGSANSRDLEHGYAKRE